jgi:hypothetical protein
MMISIYGYEWKTINNLNIGHLLETLEVEMAKPFMPELNFCSMSNL